MSVRLSDVLSHHSSSNVSVQPLYLDDGSPHSFSNGLASRTTRSVSLHTALSLETLAAPPNAPFGSPNPSSDEALVYAQGEDRQHPEMWNVRVRNGAARALQLAAGSVSSLLERLLEPNRKGNSTADTEKNALALQVEHMDDTSQCHMRPAHIVYPSLEDLDNDEEDAEEEEDVEPLRIEIDLSSTLRAYRKNPNECFGHLVAAALSSRSAGNPVTVEELNEARLNPYLVRMIVDSQRLDLDNEAVQVEVQRCVDSIIPAESPCVPLSVYEYLPSLFKLHFIRLDSEQCTVVKESGFEFVKLLCEYPHVLPPGRLNSIRLNYVQPMWYLDIFFMVASILVELLCIVVIALVLAHWMKYGEETIYQSYGYYTAIMYGAGYAAHLIGMIFLMRAKERDTVYGKMFCSFPSPHLHVVPVVPLYNFISFITFMRYYFANRREKYVAVLHDIMAAQVLSSLCFALCVAMPQFIYQTYLIADKTYVPPEIGGDYSYKLLVGATIVTCVLAMLRLLRMLATYDSINSYGFACFGFRRERKIERYSAFARMVYASCLFVFELNAFLLVVGVVNISECGVRILETIGLAGASLLLLLVVFALLLLSQESVFRIMWSMLPLATLQIALLICQQVCTQGDCDFFLLLQRNTLWFRYVIWAMFLFFLALWLAQCVVLCTMRRARSFFS
ncbi:hypothetical protein DQ04_09501010 [Trypanosoma grayi]|uniref:hypothetical protein n=1 Tax=Trypanosoma grayi TaxID=71804 RepID=UPI0004F4B0F4|nr:hypothetical protein DQ04_09501010 [Trypanosoma grayi]KEG07540.1 hypothetical protein DQ04_09501010 [Trypanosoma grayi]